MRLINNTGIALEVGMTTGPASSEHKILEIGDALEIPESAAGIFLHTLDRESFKKRLGK